MPKKTKKEKIRADKRRRMSSSLPSHQTLSSDSSPSSAVTFSYNASSSSRPTHPTPQVDMTEILAIRKDLVKTIVLALLALGVELGIYWYMQAK